MTSFSSVGPRFGSLEITINERIRTGRRTGEAWLIHDDNPTIKARLIKGDAVGDFFEVGRFDGVTTILENPHPTDNEVRRHAESINTRVAEGLRSNINYPGDWDEEAKKALRENLEEHRGRMAETLTHPDTRGSLTSLREDGNSVLIYHFQLPF